MRFTYIPLGLVLVRAMLIPVLPAISFWYGNAATTMVVIAMILGFGSDILDGVIARKLRCDTDLLRRLDSQTDAFFWLSMLLCIAINQPAWIISQRYAIGSRVRVQVSRVDLDGRKIDFRLVREGEELVQRAMRDKGVAPGGAAEGAATLASPRGGSPRNSRTRWGNAAASSASGAYHCRS